MKILKDMDLTDEIAQLKLVMKLRTASDALYNEALDTLHLMLARKTLDYYCKDGYDAFFERHHLSYTTPDGYAVLVRGHDMTIKLGTPEGTITASGSTWDYTTGDLKVSEKPPDMAKQDYAVIKRRMEQLQDSEKIVYPFHPLHRIGNGIFDTQICMYNAHILVQEQERK